MGSAVMSGMVGVTLAGVAFELGQYAQALLLSTVALHDSHLSGPDAYTAKRCRKKALEHLEPQEIAQAETTAQEFDLETAIGYVLEELSKPVA